jgi:predicted component of type VI protein secretion system
MISDPELSAQLDRIEALQLSVRETLEQHGERLDAFALEMARLERAFRVQGAAQLEALLELRGHLVDLTLDGWHPGHLPPRPMNIT